MLAYVSAASDLSEVRKPPFFEAGMRPAFPRRPQRQPSVQKRARRAGEVYTVRYDAVNAMLLNEFLKEHRKVEKLEAMVAQHRKEFEAALTDLKGQIQKVSAQLELSKASSQTVLNDQ